jgi:hypothetical protein
MIIIAKGVEVRAIVAETKDGAGHGIQFIQIEIEHEDVVPEVMLLRRKPVVHHGTFIEA